MIRILLFFIFLTPTMLFANPPVTEKKITHVIYITFDGVRWQDVFETPMTFTFLRQKYAQFGKFYGAPNSNTSMTAASTPISLPSYQAQMAGRVTPCQDNWCGRIKETTFPENILYRLGLTKKDVAIFASWPPIALAAESGEGVTLVNAGNVPMNDPLLGYPDEEMTKINAEQAQDNPGKENLRYDTYTIKQALNYYKKYQPKFMWLSLVDADEAAHDWSIIKYYKALALYDALIHAIFVTVQRLHLEGETLIIITTDHGRGNGLNWNTHGPSYPESTVTWAFVVNGELEPRMKAGDRSIYTTLSIRPTIEKVFGLI